MKLNKTLEQHGYGASGLVNMSIWWEGGAPRKGLEALPHSNPPYPCAMHLFHLAVPELYPL